MQCVVCLMVPLDEQDECPGCGRNFEGLGQHWRFSQECVPSLTEHQHKIITGSMMGDGCVVKTKETARPHFKLRVIKREYLESVRKQFGKLMTDVRLENKAENNPYSNHDVYGVQTRNLSELEQYIDWYRTGSKVWPDNISITPTVMKHWFVQDGTKKKRKSHWRPRCAIQLDNERGNSEKVLSYFDNSDCPGPDRWSEYESNGKENTRIVWNVKSAEYLYDYMGTPPKGFEYKWTDEYR